jgi:hypothetical protein
MSSNKLATFRIDDEVWQLFQDKAKANGTNASALLQGFVKDYLDDNLDSRIDTPIVSSDAIADLQSQISDLRAVINLELVEIKTNLATTHNLASEAIANIKTNETIAPKKSKPLASIAA